MAIQTLIQRQGLAAQYGVLATHSALASTVPAATAGTELTGGAPAYARIALTWSAPNASSAVTASATHNVASGSTVAGAMLFDALTAGNYRDGGGVTSQAFASQGTYAVTYTYTQT
jgi:hypothetical protein